MNNHSSEVLDISSIQYGICAGHSFYRVARTVELHSRLRWFPSQYRRPSIELHVQTVSPLQRNQNLKPLEIRFSDSWQQRWSFIGEILPDSQYVIS